MGLTTLAPDVYSVGVKDPDLAIFDIVIPTEFGTTYNAYLVKGSEKIALIDCVKRPFAGEFLRHIEEVCPVTSIDYVIINHSEPDHSGALADLLQRHPDVEVLLTRSAKTFVDNLVNREYRFRIVKDGEELSLGDKTLSFVDAPFLHWPDTMLTWLKEDRLLFTCDFLGAHYASDVDFNDELADPEAARKAFEFYYATIMRPYKEHILKAAVRVRELDPVMIAPSHGPILRKDPLSYLAYYEERASILNRTQEFRVPVVYVSAYGNTEAMARKVAQGLTEGGVKPILINAVEKGIPAIIDEFEQASGFLIGTPTLNADVPHPILELVASLVFLNMRGKPASVFGSYGWSGEAVRTVQDILLSMRMKVGPDPIKVRMTPSAEELNACVEFGHAFAEIVKNPSAK
ncbi:FprA family A-type flavoprotein [Holophaga foetida]|uniref:FprA family A-type flavoprotein n=1 Tax=Holophaga foetida TaxID=35839 RepID=UPI000247265A|nr:FprA family A-type flavoprotein [Holophaga foetida]